MLLAFQARPSPLGMWLVDGTLETSFLLDTEFLPKSMEIYDRIDVGVNTGLKMFVTFLTEKGGSISWIAEKRLLLTALLSFVVQYVAVTINRRRFQNLSPS